MHIPTFEYKKTELFVKKKKIADHGCVGVCDCYLISLYIFMFAQINEAFGGAFSVSSARLLVQTYQVVSQDFSCKAMYAHASFLAGGWVGLYSVL